MFLEMSFWAITGAFDVFDPAFARLLLVNCMPGRPSLITRFAFASDLPVKFLIYSFWVELTEAWASPRGFRASDFDPFVDAPAS